jgi:hypothetical protein
MLSGPPASLAALIIFTGFPGEAQAWQAGRASSGTTPTIHQNTAGDKRSGSCMVRYRVALLALSQSKSDIFWMIAARR